MEKLKAIYYDPKQGLLSADKLFRKVEHLGLTRKDVNAFLSQQEAFQLHKKKPRVQIYYPITAGGIGSYQADLTFYFQYAKSNRNFLGILVWINIHTRMAYAEPIKGKKSGDDVEGDDDSIIAATKKILSRIGSRVVNLTTDSGSEFTNKKFHDLMAKLHINIYHAEKDNKNKMGKVERFNRTLRGMIEKWITASNSVVWTSVLQDLIANYNSTYHHSIKSTPEKANSEKIHLNDLKTLVSASRLATHFQIGDHVRLLKRKKVFAKTGETYGKEIYEVLEVNPLSYTIQQIGASNPFRRTVQWYELQLVDDVENQPSNENPELTEDNRKKAVKIARQDRRLRTAGVSRNDNTEPVTATLKARVAKKTRKAQFLRKLSIDPANRVVEKRVNKPNRRYIEPS